MKHSHDSKSASGRCKAVRKRLANALIGQVVDLLVDAKLTVHGVVTHVLTEAGTPKVVVSGRPYDVNQILMTMPAALDSKLQTQP